MFRRLLFFLTLSFSFHPFAFAQDPPQRDPQALAVLQQSFVAMGGRVPTDIVATGTITSWNKARNRTGAVRIAVRGLHQSSEHRSIEGRDSTILKSHLRGTGPEKRGKDSLSFEQTISSNIGKQPLILVAAALMETDSAFEFAGTENDHTGAPIHRIKVWRTFAATPELTHARRAWKAGEHIHIGLPGGQPLHFLLPPGFPGPF